jgi:hypothetical protein
MLQHLSHSYFPPPPLNAVFEACCRHLWWSALLFGVEIIPYAFVPLACQHEPNGGDVLGICGTDLINKM